MEEYESEGEPEFVHEYSTQDLLARYFKIDLNKVEQERRAILEAYRS
jgi:hypothetical protein